MAGVLSKLPQLAVSIRIQTDSLLASGGQRIETSRKAKAVTVNTSHVKGPIRDWLPVCADSECVFRVDLKRLNRPDKVNNYFGHMTDMRSNK